MSPLIGIDATGWGNRRGHGRFARGAVGRLIVHDVANRYVLYADREGAAEIEPPGTATIRSVALGHPTAQAAAAGSNRSPADLLRLTRAVRRDAPDAFLFPSVYTWFPAPGIPNAVGVHDITARRMPELTLPDRRARLLWSLKETLAVRGASVVFSVSQASRDAVAAELGLRPEQVPVVSEAPDPVFAPDAGPPGFGLQPDGYLLFVGGISPHKNLMALLDAYAALVAGDPKAPVLVLAGTLSGDSYLSAAGEVRQRIDALGLGERVVLTGFVDDEQLAALYGSALATVLPSLAEGFDLPVVEAAACGSPVVLSELPCHREILADAGLFFDGRNGRSFAQALVAVVGDRGMRRRLGEAARAAVAPLSWDTSAVQLQAIVSTLLRSGSRRVRVAG